MTAAKRIRRLNAKAEDELTRLLRANARNENPYLTAAVALTAVHDTNLADVERVVNALRQHHVVDQAVDQDVPVSPSSSLKAQLEDLGTTLFVVARSFKGHEFFVDEYENDLIRTGRDLAGELLKPETLSHPHPLEYVFKVRNSVYEQHLALASLREALIDQLETLAKDVDRCRDLVRSDADGLGRKGRA